VTAPGTTVAGSAAPAVVTAAAYTTATQALRQRVTTLAQTLFGAQGYRDQGAAAYVTTMAPLADAAQRTMASLTDAYLTAQIAAATGQPIAPTGIPAALVTGAGIRGVAPATVLRLPYVQVWTDLSKGKTLQQAVNAGRARAESIAVTNLQLAKTKAAQHVLTRSPTKVIGYRRELGLDPRHCALCLLTSSRIYHKADLLPLHPGCYCTPVPVIRGETVPKLDPAQVHDTIRRDLGDKYVQAAGHGPVDYRQIVITHEHSELGPVLAVRGQHFTGPSDIPGG